MDTRTSVLGVVLCMCRPRVCGLGISQIISVVFLQLVSV